MEKWPYVVEMNYKFFIDATSHEEAAKLGLEEFIKQVKATSKVEMMARRNGCGSIDDKAFAFQVEDKDRI